jgi:hypothetical protein
MPKEWPLYRFGYQFTGAEALDEGPTCRSSAPSVTAWDHAMVARGSAHPVGILWPEMDTALVAAGVDLPVQLPLSARGVLDVRVARQVRDR